MAGKTIPAIDPAMVAALAAALGIAVPGTVTVAEAIEHVTTDKPRKVAKRNGKPASKRVASERKPASVKRTKRTCNISAGEAWVALGADPEYQPKDETKPASSTQLWRLNADGMLADLLASLA